MAKMRFLRPAEYSYRLDGEDLYASYDAVSRGYSDPSILPAAIKIPKELSDFARGASVISSCARRATETASLFSINYGHTTLLREVEYKMSQIVSQKDFHSMTGKEATTLARQNFFPKLFSNQLSESHNELVNRVISVLGLICELDGDVLAISHGFFLKFLGIAVRQPAAALDMDLFQKNYDGREPAYDFLDGPYFSGDQAIMALRYLVNVQK